MVEKFNHLIANLAPELKKIDEIILGFAQGKSPLIAEIANHLIASGGKRIRPVLLILAAKLFNENNKNCYNLAAAVELIHSATLLHDDVVDASQIRRGKKTANAIWDNKPSILVGDYLFSIAFQLMVKSENLSALNLLAKASSTMADGEVMQLENSSDINLSQEKYFDIIFGKTAVLFSASCEVAALINQASIQQISALQQFGKNLGIIFQIVDDVLDYEAKEDVLGKDLGNDFFEGKVTLPIILTLKRAEKNDQKIIANLFENNLMNAEKNPQDFQKILEIMKKYHGLELCKIMAREHHDLAIKNLEIFPETAAKENLITILEYSSARIF